MKLHKHVGKFCNVLIGYDDTTAEQWAMLAAMFSRSAAGVEELADKVRNTDSKNFMEKFYVGYGHASIGDLCDVRLFVEGVPFYVACLLEQYSRFRGQESSTRYIDFSKQAPSVTANSGKYKQQIEDYLAAFEIISNNLRKGRQVDVAEQRAINARAFDICRGLLPWGCTTNVAWYGDIRSIEQHLAWLLSGFNDNNRTISNIRSYVEDIHAALRDVYPSSCNELSQVRVFDNYPVGGSAKIRLRDYGDLDMGSWRDLNRHRLGRSVVDYRVCGDLHPWYKEMLEAHKVLIPSVDAYRGQSGIDHRLLGQVVSYNYHVYSYPHFDYLQKLRSGTSVHPTLRQLFLRTDNKYGQQYTPDPGPFGYFLQRGDQTILVSGEEL